MTEEQTIPEIQEEKAQEELRYGYIVGLKEDGNFVFELIGKQKGLVELLGLHRYAEKKVMQLLDVTQGSGDALIQEVGKLIGRLGARLETVVKAVTKGENTLE
jgi:hypothetical protein